MAKVTAPFFSAWASGSIGNAITCRPYKNGTFSMCKPYPFAHARHPNQDIAPQYLKWTALRMKTFFSRFPDVPINNLESIG